MVGPRAALWCSISRIAVRTTKGRVDQQWSRYSSNSKVFNPAEATSNTRAAATINLLNKTHQTDSWTNVSSAITDKLGRNLHLQPDHPIALTRQLIESRFSPKTYKHHADLTPIVTTAQNFDVLGFPSDHPGRSKTDTYYVNESTCLRTHTSAHQVDTFRAAQSEGYTISADVYRRDAIDRSHYPVFHQMEGARVWDRRKLPGGDLARAVWDDIPNIPRHDLVVEDPNPTYHAERNPLQDGHTAEEVEAMTAHLKRTLEDVVATIFSAVASASGAQAPSSAEPLQIRWIEAYFPFTSPSWEMEVWWNGEWLELFGSGIVAQRVLAAAGQAHKSGWAFGLGIDRIAMLLYGIPDIRLFWSTDTRFLSQFAAGQAPKTFVPFSRYPSCYKDVSFWLPAEDKDRVDAAGAGAAGGMSDGIVQSLPAFHENDMMELVREVAGDLAEDVALTDEFVHPKTHRASRCYRIHYRSLTETLTNEQANAIHEKVTEVLVQTLGVEIR